MNRFWMGLFWLAASFIVFAWFDLEPLTIPQSFSHTFGLLGILHWLGAWKNPEWLA